MFKSDIIQNEFRTLLGWKRHHDTAEINLSAGIQVSQTGEYFQQKHPALRLDYVRALLPSNQDLEQYLTETVEYAAVEMLNDFMQYRNLNNFGKSLLDNQQLLNRYGFMNDKIMNEGRFVGYQIRVGATTGLQLVIDEIGLQFIGAETFDLHLFHSSKKDPINTFNLTTSGDGQWDWTEVMEELNGFERANKNGGVYLLGYYQDDLTLEAINMTSFDWNRGVCGGCNNSYYHVWKSINEYYGIYPFYVPNGDFTVGEVPDLNNLIYISNQSFGLNLRLTAKCDLTDFFVTQRRQFKNLLALKTTNIILEMMRYSNEVNFIEENIKMMIIRDLEGDKETNARNIPQQYKDELKAVIYNTGGINEKCLPCEEDAFVPNIGVVE